MATPRKKDKLNLRFVLDAVRLPSLETNGTCKHLLTLELIWPRTGIPRRSTILTVPLVRGLCLTDAWCMANKLCFKETCEDIFGLKVGLSEPITTARLRDFMAFLVGKSTDIAANAVEDSIPMPVLDELAALPLTYLSRQLLSDQDPELIALGALDLNTLQFSLKPQKISVPLIAQKDHDDITKHDLDGEVVFSVQSY